MRRRPLWRHRASTHVSVRDYSCASCGGPIDLPTGTRSVIVLPAADAASVTVCLADGVMIHRCDEHEASAALPQTDVGA